MTARDDLLPVDGTTDGAIDHSRPVLRARAPLRISFAGGGTDVTPFPEREGGAVLSATISSFAFSTLRPRTDGQVTVRSLDYGTSIGFNIDEPVEYDGNLDLPKAAIDKTTFRMSELLKQRMGTEPPPAKRPAAEAGAFDGSDLV